MQSSKRWMYFLGAILLGLLLVWFGAKFLLTPNDRFTPTQLLIFGLLATLGGICLLSLPNLKKAWQPGVIITAIGFYGCARAAGSISEPWLARLIGLAAWVAAAFLLYFAWPGRPGRSNHS